ncbi:MAG TPA: hypothetical protein VHN80_00050 [Kineosporiaceae bacterium]|jgi:hypothetical protein|nr:hypothetical protein [Kineosporiaceae bacterium]
MPFSAPLPVVSGKPYRVSTVANRPPDRLEDFFGTITLVIDLDGDPYTVCGTGVELGQDRVHVYEKSDHGGGKDIRVWTIRRDDATPYFLAEHAGIH